MYIMHFMINVKYTYKRDTGKSNITGVSRNSIYTIQKKFSYTLHQTVSALPVLGNMSKVINLFIVYLMMLLLRP
jgi:hypothetical protein